MVLGLWLRPTDCLRMSKAPNLRRMDTATNRHLEQAWRRANVERLDPHLCVEREQRIFGLIAICDPTPNGKYLNWLSAWRRRQWDAFGIAYVCGIEDLDEVSDALKSFHEIHHTLPREYRDVGRYEDVAALARAPWLLDDASLRRVNAAERMSAMAGTDILFEGFGWTLARLRTHASGMWWGKGTRWCTARKSTHYFEHYASRGELFAILTPKGKFQYHPATDEFRDAADANASLQHAIRSAPAGFLQSLPRRN